MPTQTLFTATYRVARELGIVREGFAENGSTSTVVDHRRLTHPDDYFNNGTVWILRDAAEGNAAPEGEFALVSAFVFGTITAVAQDPPDTNAFSAAVATGDYYAVAGPRYPLDALIQAVNRALLDMGTIPIVDTTSIDTAAAQTEYTLPVNANLNLVEVWLQGQTGDADDNRWIKIQNWRVQRTATGSADLLVFPFQYPASRDVMIVYVDEHPMLDDHDDKISESVHMNRIVAEATVNALYWRKQQPDTRDPGLDDEIARWTRPGPAGISRLDRVRAMYPIQRPFAHSNYLVLGRRVPRDEFYTPPPP